MELRSESDATIRNIADDLRDQVAVQRQCTKNDAIALGIESLRRTTGIELYDCQILAALALASGMVAEMHTGEGKTFAVLPASVGAVLHGKSVHVATPNSYLAKRDYQLLQAAHELLGITISHLEESAPQVDKHRIYDAEVVYGTGCEFGFDFLRDQVARRPPKPTPLGAELIERLLRKSQMERTAMQLRHQVAIVDEVDNVLIDDADSPLILSSRSDQPAPDAEAFLAAQAIVTNLTCELDYRLHGDQIELTTSGIERIHATDVVVPLDQLRRPWSEYVKQAIAAQRLLFRNVHYIVDDKTIRIIDESTGRIFDDRTWSSGLHQAVESKEGLPISTEAIALAQITRQRYYRIYQQLSGTTGTAIGCETEFQKVYSLPVISIPRRTACRCQVLPTRVLATAEVKWQAIVDEIAAVHRSRRPVLVGTASILDSFRVAELLSNQQVPYQLLNGVQDAEEAELVSQAGQSSAVTIATNLAGRGTDIRLSDEARRLGGLHVIVAQPHELHRVDRQLIGRAARQGDPGSARLFVSAEDTLIVRHGPWLQKPILTCANRHGELQIDIDHKIRNLQRLVERKLAAQRLQLLKQDFSRESFLVSLFR